MPTVSRSLRRNSNESAYQYNIISNTQPNRWLINSFLLLLCLFLVVVHDCKHGNTVLVLLVVFEFLEEVEKLLFFRFFREHVVDATFLFDRRDIFDAHNVHIDGLLVLADLVDRLTALEEGLLSRWLPLSWSVCTHPSLHVFVFWRWFPRWLFPLGFHIAIDVGDWGALTIIVGLAVLCVVLLSIFSLN